MSFVDQTNQLYYKNVYNLIKFVDQTNSNSNAELKQSWISWNVIPNEVNNTNLNVKSP